MQLLGDFDRAEQLQIKAGVLDPLNSFNDYFLILNYIYQKKFKKAAELIDAKLSLDPENTEMLWVKAVLLVEMNRYQEAHEVLLKRKFGLETNFISGYVFARIGQKDQAMVVLENMQSKPFVSPSQLAIVYCGLEQYDLALEQIEQAFLTHDQWIAWIAFTSMTDPIKDDPRYISLMSTLLKE
jgi:tetratricopeptide (TPR) repeat protein